MRYTLRSVSRAFIERVIAILIWCSDGWRLPLGVLIRAGVRRAGGNDADRAAALKV